MSKKLKLLVDDIPTPPRPVGNAGLALWIRIQSEYKVVDSGGLEMLALACEATDRACELRAQIDADGLMVQGRENPLIKHELAARSFVVRTLQRLGLDVEPVRSAGRPGGASAGWAGR